MIKKADISDPVQVSKVINDFSKLPMSEQLFAAARVLRAHADERRVPYDSLAMSPAAFEAAAKAWFRAEERAQARG